jgi:hypothetical protein
MSMNATDDVVRSSATLFATVDLPDPDPPAIPIMSGFSIWRQSYDEWVWNASCLFLTKPESLNAAGIPMLKRVIAFAAVALSVVSCKTLSRSSANDTPVGPTVVQVDNQGFLDMTVYAARSGQRSRIGIAPGNRKSNLELPRMLISGLTPIRFIADPIGGNRASVSQEITVVPGDTVVLTIPPI